MHARSLCCLLAILLASLAPVAFAGVQMGVYYFPGWSSNIRYSKTANPWAAIEPFPQRMPLGGPYSDDDPRVLRRQLDDMIAAALSFVVFDAYAGPNGVSRQTQAIDAYLKIAKADDPKFAIMWANHDKFLKTERDWHVMVDAWLTSYLKNDRYFRLHGRPVVFIYSADKLKVQAEAMGKSTESLFQWAQQRAVDAGLLGIAFVAGSDPNNPMISSWASHAGYAAVSNYNLGRLSVPGERKPGYPGLDERYQKAWRSYYRSADLPVILPLTTGWDRTPWGGTTPAVEDASQSTADQFASHVEAAIKLMQSESPQFEVGLICCWNEYGEGSVLEPTVGFGRAHIEVLHRALIDKH